MVNCPTCGKNVAKPMQKVEAPNFNIADYKCENCGKCFRIIN